MNLEQKFKKSLEKKWFVRFETRHPDGDAYEGVVVHNGPDFIAFCEAADFEFDGLVVMPKSSISKVRDGKVEKSYNQILRLNGEIEKLAAPDWIAGCDNVRHVLASLKRRDIWPALEIVFEEDQPLAAFYIGPLTYVGDDGFDVRCYDAAGEWEKEYELFYEEVFRIEIESRYCRHFNRFMKAKGGSGKPVRGH